jgi:hypothetical protein
MVQGWNSGRRRVRLAHVEVAPDGAPATLVLRTPPAAQSIHVPFQRIGVSELSTRFAEAPRSPQARG